MPVPVNVPGCFLPRLAIKKAKTGHVYGHGHEYGSDFEITQLAPYSPPSAPASPKSPASPSGRGAEFVAPPSPTLAAGGGDIGAASVGAAAAGAAGPGAAPAIGGPPRSELSPLVSGGSGCGLITPPHELIATKVNSDRTLKPLGKLKFHSGVSGISCNVACLLRRSTTECSAIDMTPYEPSTTDDQSPRLRRTLELVYGVAGVTAARVWQWPGRVAVGVRAASSVSHVDLLRRVEESVSSVRESDEIWEFGILEDEF